MRTKIQKIRWEDLEVAPEPFDAHEVGVYLTRALRRSVTEVEILNQHGKIVLVKFDYSPVMVRHQASTSVDPVIPLPILPNYPEEMSTLLNSIGQMQVSFVRNGGVPYHRWADRLFDETDRLMDMCQHVLTQDEYVYMARKFDEIIANPEEYLEVETGGFNGLGLLLLGVLSLLLLVAAYAVAQGIVGMF